MSPYSPALGFQVCTPTPGFYWKCWGSSTPKPQASGIVLGLTWVLVAGMFSYWKVHQHGLVCFTSQIKKKFKPWPLWQHAIGFFLPENCRGIQVFCVFVSLFFLAAVGGGFWFLGFFFLLSSLVILDTHPLVRVWAKCSFLILAGWREKKKSPLLIVEDVVFAVSRIWGLALQHPRGYLPPPGFSAATSSILIVFAQLHLQGQVLFWNKCLSFLSTHKSIVSRPEGQKNNSAT